MKKFLLMLLVFLNCGLTGVSAGEGDDDDHSKVYSGAWEDDKPISWSQFDYAGYARNSGPFPYCSDSPGFGMCACGIYSTTNIFFKFGYFKKGDLPEKALQWSEEHGIGWYGPGYSWEKTDNATGGEVTYVEWVTGVSQEQYYQRLRDAYKEGYSAIINTNLGGFGHFVVLDYIEDDGDIVIIDSSNRMKYVYNQQGIKGIHIFAGKGGKGNKSQPEFWRGDSIGGSSSNRSSSDNIDDSSEGNNNVVYVQGHPDFEFDEDMIPNMPTDRDYLDSDVLGKFWDSVALSAEEQVGIAKWKEENKTQENIDIINIFRKFFVIVALILCLLGGLLPIIYVVDIWGIFGISIMGWITRGKARFINVNIPEQRSSESGIKLLTWVDMFFYALLFAGIGGFILTGWLFRVIMEIVIRLGLL